MGSIHSSFSFKSVLHIWRHFHSIFVVIIIHGSHCSHWKVSYIVYIFLFRIFSPVAAIDFFFFHLSYVYAIQIIDHIEVTSLHCLSLKSCYCLLQNIVFRVSEIQAEIVFELWKVDLSFFLLYMQVFIFCLRLVPPPFFIFSFFPLSFSSYCLFLFIFYPALPFQAKCNQPCESSHKLKRRNIPMPRVLISAIAINLCNSVHDNLLKCLISISKNKRHSQVFAMILRQWIKNPIFLQTLRKKLKTCGPVVATLSSTRSFIEHNFVKGFNIHAVTRPYS